MAMLPQDKKYWQEKLGWRTLVYLWLATIFMGGLVFPLILFLLDLAAGLGRNWTWDLFLSHAVNGLMLGTIISFLMYIIARFYLWMEWLPARR